MTNLSHLKWILGNTEKRNKSPKNANSFTLVRTMLSYFKQVSQLRSSNLEEIVHQRNFPEWTPRAQLNALICLLTEAIDLYQ